jgi:hypothetical protein
VLNNVWQEWQCIKWGKLKLFSACGVIYTAIIWWVVTQSVGDVLSVWFWAVLVLDWTDCCHIATDDGTCFAMLSLVIKITFPMSSSAHSVQIILKYFHCLCNLDLFYICVKKVKSLIMHFYQYFIHKLIISKLYYFVMMAET